MYQEFSIQYYRQWFFFCTYNNIVFMSIIHNNTIQKGMFFARGEGGSLCKIVKSLHKLFLKVLLAFASAECLKISIQSTNINVLKILKHKYIRDIWIYEKINCIKKNRMKKELRNICYRIWAIMLANEFCFIKLFSSFAHFIL